MVWDVRKVIATVFSENDSSFLWWVAELSATWTTGWNHRGAAAIKVPGSRLGIRVSLHDLAAIVSSISKPTHSLHSPSCQPIRKDVFGSVHEATRNWVRLCTTLWASWMLDSVEHRRYKGKRCKRSDQWDAIPAIPAELQWLFQEPLLKLFLAPVPCDYEKLRICVEEVPKVGALVIHGFANQKTANSPKCYFLVCFRNFNTANGGKPKSTWPS